MPETLDGFSIEEFKRVPFEQAIDWLRDKVSMPTDAWDQLWQELQDYAFTVAGITQAELLDDIQTQLIKAMEQGTGLQQWKRDFKQLAAERGWTPDEKKFAPWRVELIMQQNLRTAYAAGRWQQINDPVVAKNRPYLLYRHGDSRNPRPAHLALDGKVFPLSDSFWKTCAVPNGFGCRCKVFSLSDRDLKNMGLEVSNPPSETVTIRDKITGETQQVPAIRVDGRLIPIAEPGFAYAPGERKLGDGWVEQAIARLPDYLQQQVREDLSNG